MIRRINKVIALVLIGTSICTVAPISGSFVEIANAAVNDGLEINIDKQVNKVALAGPADIVAAVPDGNTLITMAEASVNDSLEQGVGTIFAAQGATSKVSEQHGSLSYTLSDDSVNTISTSVLSQLKGPITSAVAAQMAAKLNISQSTVEGIIASTVEKKLSDALPSAIKSRFENIPIYQYTGKNVSGTIMAQAFVVKGLVGSIVNSVGQSATGTGGSYCVNTYNAYVRNAKYNSLAPVPALAFTPTTGTSLYKKAIDLSNGAQVIGDGMSISVIDPSNNKVYVINNPVYNMLKMQQGQTSTVNRELNVIDFSGVTNLEGSLSSKLDVNGTSFPILSLALTKDGLTIPNKNYQYNMVVGSYEKNLLEKQISDLNLPVTTSAAVTNMIKNDSYIMVPNIKENIGEIVDGAIEKSGINNIVTGITNSMDKLSDSLDDLSDSLNDKNDDVDDAWDKVFDRFDNDKGWGKRDGYRYYYDKDGVSLKGVQKINGKTYYFNRIDGAMETGWQIVDGKRCYFDKKKGYQVSNQWVEDNGEKYFVGEDGTVKKMDWVNVDGRTYYVKADGKMAKDWLKIEDYWYYFNEDGSMATSTWKMNKDKWHYLKGDGQSAINWLQLGDNWYYFKDPSAEMQTGWFRADGSWYYANSDGTMKTGWAEASDGWCYLDDATGKMKKNEWVTVDGNTYYFNVNGIMVTGSRYINGKKYVFNSDGILS